MPTGIQWTDETWNVVTGCDKVSPGCDNCYIERTIPFRMEHRKFDEHGKMGIRLHPDRLEKPFHWRKPRRVFVNSLSDLFHPDVPDGFIGSLWNIMALTPQHTYQILTKRPQRMEKLLTKWADAGWYWRRDDMMWCGPLDGPLPNVWIGASAENQRYADLRIPHLLNTPAAVRFISAEPLLGPITFRWAMWQPFRYFDERVTNHLDGLRRLDWVICGGESGPGARPMSPWWARYIRDQCLETEVPFFFKQHGEFAPAVDLDADLIEKKEEVLIDQEYVVRVGKKKAGRLLDGVEWNQFPR